MLPGSGGVIVGSGWGEGPYVWWGLQKHWISSLTATSENLEHVPNHQVTAGGHLAEHSSPSCP